jgi:hypothetical protein
VQRRTTIVSVLIVAGCGASQSHSSRAAQQACQRLWSPGASAAGTLTEKKMLQAAGQPDSRTAVVAFKDIYGHPVRTQRWVWGATRILFDERHAAIAAICG